jgi:hypothetical protein
VSAASCCDTFERNIMSKHHSSDIYSAVLAALQRCDGKSLDTEKERAEVATTIACALSHRDGFFPITSLHRDDLEELGFDASTVVDGMMELLARGMEDVFVKNGFWVCLEMLAGDLKIKRK